MRCLENWEARHPVPEDPPEQFDFPVRRDYPSFSWADPPPGLPSNTACLLLRLPPSRVRTPPPAERQNEEPPPPVLKAEVKEEHRELDPSKSQHTGSSDVEKQEQRQDTFFQKQDPYEEEFAAQRSLLTVKEEPREHSAKFTGAVKTEPIAPIKEEQKTHQPSEVLTNLIKQIQQSVKQDDEVQSQQTYVPSQTVRDLLSSSRATSEVDKRDYAVRNQSRYPDPRKRPSDNDQYDYMLDSSKRIKREN